MYTNTFIQLLLNTWIKSSKSQMLQNRTVKELLWGYKDPFLNKVPFPLDPVLGVFYPVSETNEEAKPSIVILWIKIKAAAVRKKNLTMLQSSSVLLTVFSFFLCLLQYNGTFDGLYRVYTGKEDIRKTAIIESYKNKRYHSICKIKNQTYFQGMTFEVWFTKSYR